MRNGRRKKDAINVQAALSRDLNAESEPSPFEGVIEITPNVCMQKDMCQGCGRGDRYGLPLHFLFHYLDGGLRTVCFSCGMTVADKTGLRLPHTESDFFAREEEGDLKIIRAARQKMEIKTQYDIRCRNV
jgi:hypothetical protein